MTRYLKAILFLLFGISTVSHATAVADYYACLHLKVAVKNQTNKNCYLLTEESGNRSILDPMHDVSFKIAPGEVTPDLDLTSYFFDEAASIELVYECGEDAYIRLYSYKNVCGNTNTTTATVLYAAHLKATAQKASASYWYNKPASITWTIEEA